MAICNASLAADEDMPGFFIKEEHLSDGLSIHCPEVCRWRFDKEINTYFTNCGGMYIFYSGDLQENDFSFCPYCGKEIVEVR